MSQEDEKPPPEFFSLEEYGAAANSDARRLVEVAGMLIFRLTFWTATANAVFLLPRHRLAADRSLTRRGGALLLLAAQ